MVTDEGQKTAAYQSQDCANSVVLATKRLQERGCGDVVSMEEDGGNPYVGAPSDGSCSVFHPAGGGVKPCGIVVAGVLESCTTGPIGSVCDSDGAIYIGLSGTARIYARASDSAVGVYYSTPGYELTPLSTTDGAGNTDAAMVFHDTGPNSYPAAAACRAHGPQWYVPAKDELNPIWVNSTKNGGLLDLAALGMAPVYYWSSTGSPWKSNAACQYFGTPYTGQQYDYNKYTASRRVRCVRQ